MKPPSTKLTRLGTLLPIFLFLAFQAPLFVEPVQAERVQAEPVQAEPVHIGFVIDGESRVGKQLEDGIRREVEILAADEVDVHFEPHHRLSAEWTLQGADEALRALLADPDVDLIVTVGLLSSQRVCCLDAELAKPVVAATVVDGELQGLPREGAASGVANLTYVDLPDSTRDALEVFYRVAPFRKIAFLTSREIASGLPDLIASAEEAIRGWGLDPYLVDVSSSADEALLGLDALEEVHAVFIWPLYRLDEPELELLAEGLIFRGLPSFSWLGGRELEAGLLTSLREANLFGRLSRRVALDIQRILLGEDAGTIPVELRDSPRLTINAETARALGLEPPWETLLEAKLIGEAAPNLERLDLTAAMREAIEANLDLRAGQRSVAAGAQDVETARSAWRPQLSSSLTGVLIDDDRAEASFGQQAERTWTASLALQQLIYDDGAAANVEIQQAAQEAREASFESLRLDIALEAGVTYLELLRAETLQDVQRNNLDLTRENLFLAELRVDVGAANPSEVFRWQSQIASDRQALVEAAAGVDQAKLALNRLLHRPLEKDFQTVPINLEAEFLIAPDQIRGFIATVQRFRVVRDFSVDEGLQRSPDLVALRASIRAQERRLEAARRAFWLPSFAARFSLDHELDDGGEGADVPKLSDETDWSLALSGSLDLLSGGSRRAEEIQAQEEINRLELELTAAEEATAEAIRSAMVRTRASFLSIELARQSAEAARRSQELVADSYARGVVSILDLLDAQNAALNAELSATNAVYDFFIDLLSVERAGSWFYSLQPPSDRAAWLLRLGQYFSARGLAPWQPSPFDSSRESAEPPTEEN